MIITKSCHRSLRSRSCAKWPFSAPRQKLSKRAEDDIFFIRGPPGERPELSPCQADQPMRESIPQALDAVPLPILQGLKPTGDRS